MNADEPITHWHQTIDFDALMLEARKHLTKLAGELWTDHNGADPGITIMEVLAFCIADLSYRTSFGVHDIMAGYKGGKLLDIDLPQPAVALPNRPVTIKDLRKVLLDMSHPDDVGKLLIRNVSPTIATQSEVQFYAVAQKNSETFLSYTDQFTFGLNTASEIGVLQPDDVISVGLPANAGTQRTALLSANDYPVFNAPKTKPYPNAEIIELNGLYDLQIDFEENTDVPNVSHLRDLNQNYFVQEVTSGGEVYQFNVLLPYWDEIKWTLKDVDLASAALNYRKRKNGEDYFLAVDKLNYDEYFYDFYVELSLDNHLITAFIRQEAETPITSEVTIGGVDYEYQVKFLDWNELSNGVNRVYSQATMLTAPGANAGMHLINNVSVGDEHIFDVRTDYEFQKGNTTRQITLLMRITFKEPVTNDHLDQSIINALAPEINGLIQQQIDLEQAVYDQVKTPVSDLYENYLEKLNEVFRLLYDPEKGVWPYLGRYRNLCEDFSKFSASRVQEIALFGKLIVAPGFNLHQLLAEVYFQIDQFLHPLVKFHSLSEMVDAGNSFDQLFNGPLLDHGFISDSDLLNLKRKAVIYTSDLIRLIMDVEGVEAVEDFNISSYIDNRLLGRNVINCLNLTNPDVYKPKLSFDKSDLAVCINGHMELVDKGMVAVFYEALLAEQKRDQLPVVVAEAFALPVGRDMEIEQYHSIQNDFPDVYGIGPFGLPLDADDQRKAQARQLKAYLLPFEQLLANYLKHVAHLPELFSYNRSIENTYATQLLYNIPDIAPIFQEISRDEQTWADFQQDLQNTYQLAMAQGESMEDFQNRRNRFLSHQLARFGETFHDYARQLFDLHKDLLNTPLGITQYQQKRKDELNRLIDDKISFAEDYQQVSSHRYGAFDYTEQPAPGLQAYGAFKLRVCRLLGIKTVDYPAIFGQGTNGEDLEGMHIVEHILLRPRTEASRLMTLTNRTDELGKNFIYQSDKDPYSFRVTFVLPKEAGRFSNQAFRTFTERLIRMETPAHILVDFKWMTSACGAQFEKMYDVWKRQIHRLIPYYFQGTSMLLSDTGEIALTSDFLPEEILTLQDQLVHALETPCSLKLKLYDEQHAPFDATNGLVQFEEGTTDVFNLRVSEAGGTLTIEKWIADDSNWLQVAAFAPIAQTYFAFDSLVPGTPNGITDQYGGAGNYRISYELGDRVVRELVLVKTQKVMPKIYIGNHEMMLNFDTEEDGVFSRTTKNMKGYFLQFVPEGGDLSIVKSDGSVNEVIDLPKGSDRLSFTTILAKYGPGSYKVYYNLDGCQTFASIEIVPELEIKVIDKRSEVPEGPDGLTVLEWGNPYIKLFFDTPGGELKVYDLTEPVAIGGDPDALPGVLYHRKSISSLDIATNAPSIFSPGHVYDFVYSLGGVTINRRIVWQEKEPIVKPTLSLWNGDVAIDAGATIYAGQLSAYHLLATPPYGRLIIYSEAGAELLNMELESEKVSLLALPELEEVPQLVKAVYTLEGMEDCPASTYFTIAHKQSPLKAKITLWREEELVDNGVTIRHRNLGQYRIGVEPEGGTLRIVDQSGIEHLKDGTGLEWFSLSDLPDQKEADKAYAAIYKMGSQEVNIRFSVVRHMDPVVSEVTIWDQYAGDPLEPVEGVYTLVYDYKNPEKVFEMHFSESPGSLNIREEEETVFFGTIDGDRVTFGPEDLQSGEYTAHYETYEGVPLKFKLHVINLDPTFEIVKVAKGKAGYQIALAPLKANARSYIWRKDGKYFSRAKHPVLELDFREREQHELTLTMHLEDAEATYTMIVSEELLYKWSNER